MRIVSSSGLILSGCFAKYSRQTFLLIPTVIIVFLFFYLDKFKEMLFLPLHSSVNTFYLIKRINLILFTGRRFIFS
jgi:hypothetical protein